MFTVFALKYWRECLILILALTSYFVYKNRPTEVITQEKVVTKVEYRDVIKTVYIDRVKTSTITITKPDGTTIKKEEHVAEKIAEKEKDKTVVKEKIKVIAAASDKEKYGAGIIYDAKVLRDRRFDIPTLYLEAEIGNLPLAACTTYTFKDHSLAFGVIYRF